MPELSQIAVVDLRTHPKLIGYRCGQVEPELSEGGAAHPLGVHSEPVVLVGMYKSLGGKAVYLHIPAKQFEILSA